MTGTTTAAGAPAAGRRVTPTGRLILGADADRETWLREEFPDAYAACVSTTTHDRLSIPRAVRQEHAR